MQHTVSIFKRIESLFETAKKPELDDFLRAHIIQLICVLASGAIESACKSILIDHCRRKSSPRVARYSEKQLSIFRNPNPTKILNLLRSFDEDWATNLESYWEGEIKDSLSSIVNNRNLISHGGNTSVSLIKIEPWIKCAEKFCYWLQTTVEKVNSDAEKLASLTGES